MHRIAGIGGSERHLLTLLPALRERGVEPVFVGLDASDDGAMPFYDQLATHDLPVVRLAAPRDVHPLLAARLVRAVRALEPDLVHTHLVHGDAYGALAAKLAPAALVSTKHNDDRFRVGLFRFAERALARPASRIIAITRALARFTVGRVGLPAAKVEVVHYGLEDWKSVV